MTDEPLEDETLATVEIELDDRDLGVSLAMADGIIERSAKEAVRRCSVNGAYDPP